MGVALVTGWLVFNDRLVWCVCGGVIPAGAKGWGGAEPDRSCRRCTILARFASRAKCAALLQSDMRGGDDELRVMAHCCNPLYVVRLLQIARFVSAGLGRFGLDRSEFFVVHKVRNVWTLIFPYISLQKILTRKEKRALACFLAILPTVYIGMQQCARPIRPNAAMRPSHAPNCSNAPKCTKLLASTDNPPNVNHISN